MTKLKFLPVLDQPEVKSDFDQVGIVFTEEAKSQLAKVWEPGGFLRIGVRGAGCLGFSHVLEFIKPEQVDSEEDYLGTIDYEGNSYQIVLDCFSADYMKETKIDYIHTLKQSGFEFTSDKVKRKCGCGSSFSV